jgi:hypothetical protein
LLDQARGENNIKMNLTEIGCEDENKMELAQVDVRLMTLVLLGASKLQILSFCHKISFSLTISYTSLVFMLI